jgi:hypothetical protein
MIAFSYYHVFVNDNIGFKNGPFADGGAAADKAVRPDYDAVLQLCAVFDDRGSMYLFHFHILLKNSFSVFNLS